MSGIAGIIQWDGSSVAPGLIEGMLQSISHRGPDGLHSEIHGGVGFGEAKFILNERERDQTQPVWLPDGSCVLVADARLYNRDELLKAIGPIPLPSHAPSDAEILLAAYAQWGTTMLPRLRGDFSFAVWDQRAQCLFAARDPFGVKPFFFHSDTGRFCFGSEPKQLLEIPGVPREPNDGVIADYLVHGFHRAFDETFFFDVSRLRAGHWLMATKDSVQQHRYWPAKKRGEDFPGTPQASAEQFYELFRESVRRRLQIDAPLAMELSGGYDSSAVVLAAADVYSDSSPSAIQPVTLSVLYPGFDCDERTYSDAVADCSPFEHFQVEAPCGDFTNGLTEEFRKVDAPTSDFSRERRIVASALLKEHGCKVVLTGLGGDDLTWDPDYELDLWRSRNFLAAIRYCLSDPRIAREHATLPAFRRLLSLVVPNLLKQLLGRGKRRHNSSTPAWINQQLIDAQDGYIKRSDPGLFHHDAGDLARSAVSTWLTNPGFLYLIEQEECLSAYHGLELKHPFLDQDLAEFVLSIPYLTRMRVPGSFKTILAIALGDRLPAKLRNRASKSVFDEYFLTLLKKALTAIVEVSETFPDQATLAYIDWERARDAISGPLPVRPNWFGNVRVFWQPFLIRKWLHYNNFD